MPDLTPERLEQIIHLSRIDGGIYDWQIVRDLARKILELWQQNAELREAWGKFGCEHTAECNMRYPIEYHEKNRRCTCGFDGLPEHLKGGK